jgi:conjugal transfer mating pair stabilization protein TraG
VRSDFINKKIKSFRRRLKRKRLPLIGSTALLFLGILSYAYYMESQQLSINPASCKQLLDVIAHAESNGNYNAYFGNSHNTKVDFTKMSIANVLKWQQEYIKQGSPSSAVGRYQILNTTLASLVDQLGIHTNQKFDKSTQDTMAVALLERRGAVEYADKKISDEQFAANLAKEWAGLPKIMGDNPKASYYANDGLNKSRVEPAKVLTAIKPIETKK